MAFDTRCQRCDFEMTLADHTRGKSIRCPACGRSFTAAPLAEQAAAAEARARAAPAANGILATAVPPVPAAAATAEAVSPSPMPAAAAPRARRWADVTDTLAYLPYASGMSLLAGLAFCLASVALLLASFPTVDLLSKPLSLLALLCAVGAMASVLERPWGAEKVLPFVAGGLSLLVLLLAGPWPWQGRGTVEQPPDPSEVLVIPLGDQGMKPRARLEMGAWTDASKAELQQQGVRVRVAQVLHGPAELIQGQKKRLSAPVLTVRLRLANTSLARRVAFRGWTTPAGPDAPPLQLSADSGSVLAAAKFPEGWLPQGPAEHELLLPGRSLQETLWFEPPSKPFTSLLLELPAGAFEGVGVLRFRIPASLILRF